MHTLNLTDFLTPVNKYELSDDQGYLETQLGSHIEAYEESFPELEQADIVIVGCDETRGAGIDNRNANSAADLVRREFYSLYRWHTNVHVADLGNVKIGATLQDSYVALKTVIADMVELGKKVVVIGGSHDLTLAQYDVYVQQQKVVEAAIVDARIDINWESTVPAHNFLMKMLTTEPNFIRHYNHIGFQSYFVHPNMLETIDKLRFDCYRVGKVKEKIEEMEPVVRNASLFSFDISAIQSSHAPANRETPNGFNGEEACSLMQYAGMSAKANSIGIYGYLPQQDVHSLTAKQVSHMLWYLMDGIHKGKTEAAFADTDNFNQYKMVFSEVEATFLQSKRTGRWWMQLPDGKYIACTQSDYLVAATNDIPERWMRAMER